MTSPRLYRVTDVADLLGYTPRTVQLLIRSGRLRAVRLGEGSPWRVTADDLADFIDRLDSNDVA